jgi:hypothetical protein
MSCMLVTKLRRFEGRSEGVDEGEKIKDKKKRGGDGMVQNGPGGGTRSEDRGKVAGGKRKYSVQRVKNWMGKRAATKGKVAKSSTCRVYTLAWFPLELFLFPQKQQMILLHRFPLHLMLLCKHMLVMSNAQRTLYQICVLRRQIVELTSRHYSLIPHWYWRKLYTGFIYE